MFTVVIPVLYLTDYSLRALSEIKRSVFINKDIRFLLSCKSDVRERIEELFNDALTLDNIEIIYVIDATSNALRHQALSYVKTQYLVYQDCDDIIHYDILKEGFKYCNGSNVVCFNIRKRLYDDDNNLIKEHCLYLKETGAISNIQDLPTNIVNKLIPCFILQRVSFYNLPFSQDLSLSYQLFNLADHFFVAKEAYDYESNSLSTSGIKKTQYKSLLRVAAMERILSRFFSDNKYNSAYIKYRYEIILQSRFAFLGRAYCPSFSMPIFSVLHFGTMGVIRHFIHYARAYMSCIKQYLITTLYAHVTSV